jgi:hypothetical protein
LRRADLSVLVKRPALFGTRGGATRPQHFRPQEEPVRLSASIALCAAALALPNAVSATEVQASDPQSVVAALQQAGYRAQLSVDDVGDPLILSSESGTTFRVFFYNCTDNVDCRTIQFYVGFSDTDATLESVNAWNRDNRFGRAYLGDDGVVRLEMDVDLDDGGMSQLLFEDNVQFWASAMARFAMHFGSAGSA